MRRWVGEEVKDQLDEKCKQCNALAEANGKLAREEEDAQLSDFGKGRARFVLWVGRWRHGEARPATECPLL